ncbi:MAG: alpha/beta fold hydrolase [Acidimicrobiales bacterium]|nr:alpha/beta fold hydrolase [Acidimicrobiales bacterium]
MSRTIRLLTAVLSLLMISTALVTTSASAAPRDTKINWRSCYRDIQQVVWPDEFSEFFGGPVRFECATVPVPIDYDGSSGGTLQLSVVRIPSTNPSSPGGSLFSNPGGPSGSGVEFTLFSAPLAFSPELRANFDIIGFDPRGILLSTPARCYGNYKNRAQDAFQNAAFPITDAEKAAWLAGDDALQAACAQRGNKVLDHMSTANVARDMDRLREAVGDEQLTYIGYSYGTMVGATYANLFPDRVRAIALDSALDPVEWTTGRDGTGPTVPVSSRLKSHEGAQDALELFFDLCDNRPDACPIAPNSAERYRAILDALTANPVQIEIEFIDFETGGVFVELFTYRASDLVGDTLGILYSGDAWPIISFIVADIEGLLAAPPSDFTAFGRNIRALRTGEANSFVARAGLWQGTLATKVGPPKYFNFLEGFPGVLCSDATNPDDAQVWTDTADSLDENGYIFGPLWTWSSSVCDNWPGADDDRYTGPWNAETANPVLVVNNEFDPATAYVGAVAMDNELGNSQLLTVVGGRGHIASQSSACAAFFIEQYVLTQSLPPVGLDCEPNVPDPFDNFGPPSNITIVIEGPDGEPISIETLVINGEVIQPPLILEAADGEIIIIEPVVVPLGTGETATVDLGNGEILVFEPFDVLGPDGELVTVEANVIRNAVILEVIEG